MNRIKLLKILVTLVHRYMPHVWPSNVVAVAPRHIGVTALTVGLLTRSALIQER